MAAEKNMPLINIEEGEEKRTPEEIEAARQAVASEITQEQIGEVEHNLKNRYLELFNELKNKKEPAKEIFDNIQEDQNELAQLYEPEMHSRVIKIYEAIKESFKGKDEKINELIKTETEKNEDESSAGDFENRLDSYKKLLKGRRAEQVKKDEIYRGELGAVFNRIKLEAIEETGYKDLGVQKRTEKKQELQAEITAVPSEEIDETEFARRGTQITLSKIKNYQDLLAATKQEGDEKFKKKTRELWKEFAVHGKVVNGAEGKPEILNFTDLDGKCSLGLLKLAGIKTGDLKYLHPGGHLEGRINIDTGNRHGVILEEEGKTAFIDHHSDESGRASSATKFTYELLASLDLLKKEKYLDELVEFVTQLDNKTFPNEERYFKDSWHTILGLDQFMQFKNLADYFKDGRKPTEILSEQDLKKIGGEQLVKRSKEQKQKVEDSLKELDRMEDRGLIFSTGRYGNVAVDIGKKVPAGFDAAKAHSCQTYIIWKPETKSFFISSTEEIENIFPQGIKVRKNMWIKPPSDPAPLTVKLGEILEIMTDGKLQPYTDLKNYLEQEAEGKKAEKAIKTESAQKQEVLDEEKARLEKIERAKKLMEKYNIKTLADLERLLKKTII